MTAHDCPGEILRLDGLAWRRESNGSAVMLALRDGTVFVSPSLTGEPTPESYAGELIDAMVDGATPWLFMAKRLRAAWREARR